MMNSKQVLATLGFSALAVTLVALSGSSARAQDPAGVTTRGYAQIQDPQDPGVQIQQLHQALGNLQLAHVEPDDNLQVFVSDGGSWLGAGIEEVNADKAKELKLPAERGVVLGKIVPESPAAKAGLKESDVVTEINGQRVEGTEQFRRMIREIPAGRSVQFSVWRDGRSQTVSVTIGKSELRPDRTLGGAIVAPAAPGNFAFRMPDMPDMGQVFMSGPMTLSRTRLGIDAENLDGDFGNYFGAPDGEGILVRGVFPDTPAAKAGLKVGDVITSMNGERIRSIGELRSKMAEKTQEKSMKLGIVRNKAQLSLSVELPAPAEKKTLHTQERTNI
jgi:serine protease Do